MSSAEESSRPRPLIVLLTGPDAGVEPVCATLAVVTAYAAPPRPKTSTAAVTSTVPIRLNCVTPTSNPVDTSSPSATTANFSHGR
ncbi:hypothetical protein L1857_11280 [Amycolatopsis thermalba]|uniref:Uncharacterized protein n=1 Tax=Amycolatopsis thermalba TaxID=944492 RepID=A0ABY4NTI3_9PSEU|nr:hypothetical protein L1857_11280 [Amycolatopsis thermalba]